MSVITFKASYINQQLNDHMVTPEGGVAIKMINDTGGPSVKGSVVSASSLVANAVELQTVEYDCVGVIYEDGIANGQEVWVVISGVAEVLLEDGISSVLDYWVFASDIDGRADMLAVPPGGTIAAIDNHFKEIGHSIEAKASGTNVLAKILLHFN